MLQSAATPDPRKPTTHARPDNPTRLAGAPAFGRWHCAVAQHENSPANARRVRLFKA